MTQDRSALQVKWDHKDHKASRVRRERKASRDQEDHKVCIVAASIEAIMTYDIVVHKGPCPQPSTNDRTLMLTWRIVYGRSSKCTVMNEFQYVLRHPRDLITCVLGWFANYQS